MRQPRVNALALVAGLVLGVAAAHAAETSPPATGSAPAVTEDGASGADPAAAALQQHHRVHNSGGLTKFVAMGLDTLGTMDEAKRPQIEKLQADLVAHMAPAREAEKALLQALADGVAGGALDKAKVDAALAKVTSAATAKREADYATLNEIHKVLSKEERAALVDKVEAHWEVWSKVNGEASAGVGAGETRLAQLTEEAALTPEQVTKISAALKASPDASAPRDPKRREARIRAFATGFVTESFDAKSLASTTSAVGGRGSKRMALFYETATPLLTPEQRTKVAENLREHASYEPAAPGK
jgi:Spy/CpxP family protein refolding chaperone